jgi:transposase InsO family protein
MSWRSCTASGLSIKRPERSILRFALHFATLLDEGSYLCSVSTMYRLLAEQGEVRERRNQLVHPAYAKPELLATAPNQVWSWDITKLLGPVKWSYFYLYVIMDIFSRYPVKLDERCGGMDGCHQGKCRPG